MARRLTSEAGGDMAKLDIMSKNFGMFSNLSNPKLRTQAMQFMAQLSPESAKAMQGKSFEEQARIMLKTSTTEEQNQLAMALEQNAGRDIMAQIMDKLNKWIPTLISGIAAIQYNTANSKDTAMKEDARRTREEADKMNKNISAGSNRVYSSKIMVGG
jgi:transketolase